MVGDHVSFGKANNLFLFFYKNGYFLSFPVRKLNQFKLHKNAGFLTNFRLARCVS